MEALILYCATGGGHRTAALAMEEELLRRGHKTTLLDPYSLVGRRTARAVGDSYVKLVQRSPKGFGALYAIGSAYDRLPLRSPVYWANGMAAKAMEGYLKGHPFDCIVMTHMFPAQMLAHLAAEGASLPKTLLIATDYTCVPFFEESSCDWYGIPSGSLAEEFTGKGLPGEKMLPWGIPVRRQFAEAGDKSACRERLGWSPQAKRLLLAGGSMGAGNLVGAVEILAQFLRGNPEYQLTVICGSNRRLYQRLAGRYQGRERVEILGATDKMATYLRACDVFLTKPGGLSSTEAAVCRVPLIHLLPIPGCETANARFFSSHGMSLYVSRPEEELLEALELLKSPQRREAMVLAQGEHSNPNAAKAYCDMLEKALR